MEVDIQLCVYCTERWSALPLCGLLVVTLRGDCSIAFGLNTCTKSRKRVTYLIMSVSSVFTCLIH